MQTHIRVCEKSKLEEENDTYWNNVVVTGVSLKDHIGEEWWIYQDGFLKDDLL